jgi:formylglycine-generating enzyme required for sulfatase activity
MAFVPQCGGFCIDRYEAHDAGQGRAGSAPGKEPWVGIDQPAAAAACAAASKRLCKDFEWVAACDLEGRVYRLTDEETGEEHGCRTMYVSCMDRPCLTGSAPRCRSAAGVYDMIGSVWEWTDARVPDGSWSEEASGPGGYVGELLGEERAKYGDDRLYKPATGGRGNGFLRGGGWGSGGAASPGCGCFALNLFDAPSETRLWGGFRCCAD